MRDWRTSNRVRPLEGGDRGTGSRRGEPGEATFLAGVYPACSLHGALTALGGVGTMKWRCLVPDCNAGAETDRPWESFDAARRAA